MRDQEICMDPGGGMGGRGVGGGWGREESGFVKKIIYYYNVLTTILYSILDINLQLYVY